MTLTPRELANVLLALRILQDDTTPFDGAELILDGHDIMSEDEIDDLCEKINVIED